MFGNKLFRSGQITFLYGELSRVLWRNAPALVVTERTRTRSLCSQMDVAHEHISYITSS